ncbi:MAG: hypothetical protein COY38_04045 [Candidatus Aenigmarchaeota archaeon CG_4_10_14_0_8_um_filter_37_24]|nr:MAG: hypothetical protein COS07_03185 [Candidatus Aenigmarchaeota archaeon CG01_land_8_20_14_3_00_37_9]PIW40838.1 MAG: hypothetical protein COW21_05005 [Candidatus Aenigmarchaeota archaeon CG15_BIG_FIL_POST_REV_8_21_14_020_37_27]PIX51212.1 MAG: hypothetical protein COZ52_00030 [Candidatus Aenigmarchaeota archaeon CG_4_8_14_3_um_filter_37_24]PIY34812.1 MAG: hypothetical protein COZ04_05655 [Candidatus Aenigmarchaeota archaeon CG_4_10_14_3_um_filter_37_21]PIZ34545.1 MAG: hypothetical protein C
MENGIERKILEEMCERLVASKSEILGFLVKEDEIPTPVIDSVTKTLVQRGLLTKIYSSAPTFAITQKGMKEASIR